MQQMIAPFRADVQPVGGWRTPLPSHRLFAPDLADRQPVRRTKRPSQVVPLADRQAASEAVARAPADVVVAAASGRAMRRLTRSVLMFLERARCLG